MSEDGRGRGPAAPPAVVRVARPDEHAAAGEVTVAAYAPYLVADDPYADRLRDAGRRAAEAELLVAVDDGDRVLGTVTACPPGSPWRELSVEGEAEFRMLAVDPDARGRGVGAALVGHLVERARRDGARRLVLSSLPMMAEAHRLYGRLGFARCPARDWAPVPEVSLIAFTLDLDPDPEDR